MQHYRRKTVCTENQKFGRCTMMLSILRHFQMNHWGLLWVKSDCWLSVNDIRIISIVVTVVIQFLPCLPLDILIAGSCVFGCQLSAWKDSSPNWSTVSSGMLNYTVIHNYQTPSFQRHNLVNIRFISIKKFHMRARDNAVWSAIRISTICAAFTVLRLRQHDIRTSSGWRHLCES